MTVPMLYYLAENTEGWDDIENKMTAYLTIAKVAIMLGSLLIVMQTNYYFKNSYYMILKNTFMKRMKINYSFNA